MFNEFVTFNQNSIINYNNDTEFKSSYQCYLDTILFGFNLIISIVDRSTYNEYLEGFWKCH